MNPKYLIVALIALVAVFGWNLFLVQRDAQLFEKYSPVTQLK